MTLISTHQYLALEGISNLFKLSQALLELISKSLVAKDIGLMHSLGAECW